MEEEALLKEILSLKKQKNAVILAHYYQIPQIQAIADYVGDSLALAHSAKKTDANIIVFAGVHFMAETAKILNPNKKVLLPDLDAGCSLADSCKADDLKKLKDKHKDHIVVSYINCSSEVKCLSDIICTSGNALKIVNSLPKDQKILFVPDKNLGSYINKQTGRDMLLWQGSCTVHDMLNAEKILLQKKEHPNAKLIAHPECNDAVLQIADFVGSTAAMLDFVQKDPSKEFIVATESGILYEMEKRCKDKIFHIVEGENCACNDCPYMKLNTLEKLYDCLKNETPEITLSKEVIEQAAKPIERMLSMS